MAGKRKKKPEEHENHERWLITYSDLITLLMVFFIVMYSMSQVDVAKYEAMAQSLSVVLGGGQSFLDGQGPSVIENKAILEAEMQARLEDEAQIQELRSLIEEFIAKQENEATSGLQGQQIVTKLSENIVLMEQERGLVISFKDSLLFPSGSAQLSPLAQEIIIAVGQTLIDVENYIRVEGHTDNQPIRSSQYPSNWELSAARATNVVHLLQDKVNLEADRLSLVGYGEYRPLVENVDDASRRMNRRVDIVILKKKYDYFEPINLPMPVPADN